MLKQTARIEIITPEKAKMLLLKNRVNRPKSQAGRDKMAADMLNGQWELNAATIRIADTGRMLDGQTRLEACVKAGVPFETWVVRGIPENFVYKMDQVRPRTVAHMHAFDGEKHVSSLGAAINIVSEILGGPCIRLTYERQKEMLAEYPDIREVITAVRLKFMKVPKSSEHGAFWVGMRAYGFDWTTDWFQNLSKSQFDHAQAAFDQYMKKRAALPRNEEYLSLAAILVKAMKWSKTGRKVALTFNREKEEFPLV